MSSTFNSPGANMVLFRKMVLPLAILGMAATSPAIADVSKSDLLVASKALNFMVPKVTGDVLIAVVFDPSDSASLAEADQAMSLVGGGLKAGKSNLTAVKVPVSDLSAISNSKMVLVTAGTGAHRKAIMSAADAANVLTVSTDMSCVESANCVAGIVSKPKVVIKISTSAKSAAAIEFASAFTMMVLEIN
jgi:hypothetical protein